MKRIFRKLKPSIVRFPRKLDVNVNINNVTPKEKSSMYSFTNIHNYSVFIFGSLLAISEALPFMDTQSNGILHSIQKIFDYYKNL
jgi:hypothetical protein